MASPTIRKLRSAILRCVRRTGSLCRVAVVRLANPGVSMPWHTWLGRGVLIQVTDGGTLRVDRGVAIGACTAIQVRCGSVSIGEHTFIGHGCTIFAGGSISIGAKVLLAEYVALHDQDHRVDTLQAIADAGSECEPIIIGEGVWLGAKVSVLRGACIGDGAVIGAHALVTGNIPERAIAVGIPARVKRFRRNTIEPTA